MSDPDELFTLRLGADGLPIQRRVADMSAAEVSEAVAWHAAVVDLLEEAAEPVIEAAKRRYAIRPRRHRPDIGDLASPQGLETIRLMLAAQTRETVLLRSIAARDPELLATGNDRHLGGPL